VTSWLKIQSQGNAFFSNEDGDKDCDEHLDNLQSGAWCFSDLSLLAKDNKDTYEKYLRPIYEYCDELLTVGVPKKRWKPFLVSEPQDIKSNWLCLKRGGPAKAPGVKHFCHLCQIRSDDIALPNQLSCLACLDNGPDYYWHDLKCFHRPVMDANTITKAKEDLKKLETCPIASYVCKACQSHNPECSFEKFYDDCKLNLMDVGRQAGLNDTSMDTDYYSQCMSETLDMFGVLELYHNKPLSEQKTLVRRLLIYVCRFKHIDDCLAFEASVSNAIVKVDNQTPCILHLHKRVIEKIMTMICCVSLDEVSTTNKAARKRQCKKNAQYINTLAYGNDDDPGNYKVPYDTKTCKIAEVKFDDSRAKQLELHL
jgi:hypothetical protein